ncbi:MAG: hypothetical protein ACE5FL_13625 [Myxococcota bacterium]
MDDRDAQARTAMMMKWLESRGSEHALEGMNTDDLIEAAKHPRAPEVMAEIASAEAHSVKQGDPAPDFTLPRLPRPGRRDPGSVTLSSHFGDRPVALVFGSYT